LPKRHLPEIAPKTHKQRETTMPFVVSSWSWLVSIWQWAFSDEGVKALGVWGSIATIPPVVAVITIWLFKRFRAQKKKEPEKPSEALTKRNRERMLKRVLHDWVKPGLENSLYHIARLELGLKETPDAIEHPWKLCIEQLSQQPERLPSGIPMREVFHRFNDTLLLLGAHPAPAKQLCSLSLRETSSRRLSSITKNPYRSFLTWPPGQCSDCPLPSGLPRSSTGSLVSIQIPPGF
jgi:hypothetical protein